MKMENLGTDLLFRTQEPVSEQRACQGIGGNGWVTNAVIEKTADIIIQDAA